MYKRRGYGVSLLWHKMGDSVIRSDLCRFPSVTERLGVLVGEVRG